VVRKWNQPIPEQSEGSASKIEILLPPIAGSEIGNGPIPPLAGLVVETATL